MSATVKGILDRRQSINIDTLSLMCVLRFYFIDHQVETLRFTLWAMSLSAAIHDPLTKSAKRAPRRQRDHALLERRERHGPPQRGTHQHERHQHATQQRVSPR